MRHLQGLPQELCSEQHHKKVPHFVRDAVLNIVVVAVPEDDVTVETHWAIMYFKFES
jgi:hypothetical protein